MNISYITSFDGDFDPLSMKNIFEAEKLETEPTFENTINEIKYNHLGSIASAAMNLSAIAFFDENIDTLYMNNIYEAAKFEPEPKIENTINEIKSNHFKIITSIVMNVSDIT